MRDRPTAFGWIDPAITIAPEWDAAQLRRLARRLGYVLVWPPEMSLIPLVDQVRAADVDVVIAPSPAHLDVIMLHAIMSIAEVETHFPRMSFARWAALTPGRFG
ncbi:hypothetical protein BJY24_007063 [Nocardia transvalensis]|uniref:Uncharacterized protein n=1 Tax=Nocardia transvalensis TaxID=37333 RepID=A0A7W9UM14_9NOCA|nr:hypothetical protein [Nocardia transvalensis]MBB5918151.1 hypothetical protein [Nocardia transvalensis]